MTEEELRAIVELEEYVLNVVKFINGGDYDWIGSIHHKNGIGPANSSKRIIIGSAKTKEGCINKLYKRWVEAK